MTTIILVILGVLLAAAAVLFVIYYGGDAFGNGRIEAEAGRLVGEGAQMEAALELYYRQEGSYPTSSDPIDELIGAGYLTHQPLGTRTQDKDRWAIDYDAGMIRAKLGDTQNEDSLAICTKARLQLDLPEADTETGIYRCDGSDSPTGRLSGREPCCIGEVAVGGGPSEPGSPEDTTPPDICGEAPPASASYSDRGTWLGCYAQQVNAAAVKWIHAGRGMTPSISQLRAADMIHHLPPAYPEISSFSVTNFASNYVDFASSAPANNKPVYLWIVFDGAGLSVGSAFSNATAANSSGYLTRNGGAFWHVYSQPIYWPIEYEEKVTEKNPTWVGPVPTQESSLSDKSAYLAFRLMKFDANARAAIAGGAPYENATFSTANLVALGYPTPERGDWTETSGVSTRTSTSAYGTGSPGTGGPNYYVAYYYRESWAQPMCRAVENFTYGRAKCDSYGTNYYNALPRVPSQ